MKRSGEYVTNLSGEAAYRSFRPSPLPPQLDIDNEMLGLLISATKALTVLDEMSKYIPSIDLFVSMYVRKEALLSSQIEGTQATLEDVLDPMAEENANRNVSDVINYIKATEYALERIKTLPLCSRLIKETHKVLLGGVRGDEKNPGEFRISQNWIGAQGSSLKNARYIPPNVDDMNVAISDLEKYINSDDSLDVLIQAALIHYQFETIHPFLDGNGRVGRLLITLFLMEKKALRTPSLYISYYLKMNRIEYYDRMSEVRNKDNYEQWVKFFLRAIAESSEDAVETVTKLSALHNKNTGLIKNTGKTSKNSLKLFSYLEKSPIIDIMKTSAELGLSYNTVSKLVKRFEGLGILRQSNDRSRNRVFAYEDYLEILRKDT